MEGGSIQRKRLVRKKGDGKKTEESRQEYKEMQRKDEESRSDRPNKKCMMSCLRS